MSAFSQKRPDFREKERRKRACAAGNLICHFSLITELSVVERLNIDLHFTQTEQWHKVTAERGSIRHGDHYDQLPRQSVKSGFISVIAWKWEYSDYSQNL